MQKNLILHWNYNIIKDQINFVSVFCVAVNNFTISKISFHNGVVLFCQIKDGDGRSFINLLVFETHVEFKSITFQLNYL